MMINRKKTLFTLLIIVVILILIMVMLWFKYNTEVRNYSIYYESWLATGLEYDPLGKIPISNHIESFKKMAANDRAYYYKITSPIKCYKFEKLLKQEKPNLQEFVPQVHYIPRLFCIIEYKNSPQDTISFSDLSMRFNANHYKINNHLLKFCAKELDSFHQGVTEYKFGLRNEMPDRKHHN